MKTKVCITLEEDLLKQFDDYCDENYLNRSSYISQLINRELITQKLIDSVSSVALSIRAIADNGKLDGEMLQKLQEFEVLSRTLLSK